MNSNKLKPSQETVKPGKVDRLELPQNQQESDHYRIGLISVDFGIEDKKNLYSEIVVVTHQQ